MTQFMKRLISFLLGIYISIVGFAQRVPTGKDAFTPDKQYVIHQDIALGYVEWNVGVFYSSYAGVALSLASSKCEL